MRELLLSYGYPALFLLSFLASTLIPIGSEWLLVALLLHHTSPAGTVLVASAGNYLGAVTSYLIGLHGSEFMTTRVLRLDQNSRVRAEQFFQKHGSWSLLFTWLPVVGDPLCLVGGVLRIPFARFSILVGIGKTLRYAAVAWLTLQGAMLVAN